ncbi:unnamed protein product [Didymodactylos carnosus]|uniref:Uncharacterized protein n=1 Tax=Didymodactylos carnosus TaxID=1234261 RepID=A0A813WPH5_9BILA|nr:unnamed protein product [Didymodactylos carnosus]CAF0894987.1 unnamed protein product [Didymodactylos carnosus]CAF3641885.1 unnamed protein product [Didymodactylos carnosus]CAF3676633.1 unnamed protein product [Didymodactylos carnosus]
MFSRPIQTECMKNADIFSFTMDESQTKFIFVGNHCFILMNFELSDCLSTSNIHRSPLFDPCNVNKPVIEWNRKKDHTTEFCVAIDRTVSCYTLDQSRITSTSTILYTDHQRPISTVCYSVDDSASILTGSLDGTVHVWDTRKPHRGTKSVDIILNTPYTVRRIKSDPSSTTIAVQCDQCVRLYDIRQPSAFLGDYEHTSRLIDIDWRKSGSLLTLSINNIIRLYDPLTIKSSTHPLYESQPLGDSSQCLSKIRSTPYPSLFLTSVYNHQQQQYGFLPWQINVEPDDDGGGVSELRQFDGCQRIINNQQSLILDFQYITSTAMLQICKQDSESHYHNQSDHLNRIRGEPQSPRNSLDHSKQVPFLIVSWSKDDKLRISEIDDRFKMTLYDYMQNMDNNSKEAAIATSIKDIYPIINEPKKEINVRRGVPVRKTIYSSGMDVISEYINGSIKYDDGEELGEFKPLSARTSISSDRSITDNSKEKSTTQTSEHLLVDQQQYLLNNDDKQNNDVLSVASELSSLNDTYGNYITVQSYDIAKRSCTVLCKYGSTQKIFQLQLILSKNYPIVANMVTKFKPDKFDIKLQSKIQQILDDKSQECLYQGQICLDACLQTLAQFLFNYNKQQQQQQTVNIKHTHLRIPQMLQQIANDEDLISTSIGSTTGVDIGVLEGDNNNNVQSTRTNSSLMNTTNFTQSSSAAYTYFLNTSMSTTSAQIQLNARTCGARFSGIYIVCFGKSSYKQIGSRPPTQQTLMGGDEVTNISEQRSLTPIMNKRSNIPQSQTTNNLMLVMSRQPTRSTSLTGQNPKSRGNSSTDEPIHQQHKHTSLSTDVVNISKKQTPTNIFSAPTDYISHQRLYHYKTSTGYDLPSQQQQQQQQQQRTLRRDGPVAVIYDLGIILPISQKLAGDYTVDYSHTGEMCTWNQQITSFMGKQDLAQCWKLLSFLLCVDEQKRPTKEWYSSPIARGLIEHMVEFYRSEGDIQSSAMFLMTMFKTPYMDSSSSKYDCLLYGYSSILHRWKYFYKRTQCLSLLHKTSSYLLQVNNFCLQTHTTTIPLTPSSTSTIYPIKFPTPTMVNRLHACSICHQPIHGPISLCPGCGHSSHSHHLYHWFLLHHQCPLYGCNCACLLKYNDLLRTNDLGMKGSQSQQQSPYNQSSHHRVYRQQ